MAFVPAPAAAQDMPAPLTIAEPGAVRPPAPAQPPARFFVRAIQVTGNTILPPDDVERIVYPFMGPDRSPDDIEAARAALQKAFEDKGYATTGVIIPEQGVETGIILLQVQSQAIGSVQVVGGHRGTDRWVRRRAPSLVPGAVPNFRAVQEDIVALNQSANRRVTPEVKAGVAPGTVDVVLKVDESSPFHVSAELNNYRPASTTDLRVAGSLRYDDLWGRGDSISVSAQTAPRNTNDGTVFSANYLAHVGGVQLLCYFVRSDSNIAVVGGVSVIGKGDLAGGRVIVPLGAGEGFSHALTAGVDYKNFKENVKLGVSNLSAPIRYFPATVSWRGDWFGERAKSNLSFTTTFGIRGIGNDRGSFDDKRNKAKPNFFYLRADGATTRSVGGGQVYGRLTGQYSASPLIANEEFSVGGMETVRGYFESETLGDFGVAGQFEVRSPELFPKIGFMGDLRMLAFVDAGYSGIHMPLFAQTNRRWLVSVGSGVRIRLFRYFNGFLDVAMPLRNGPDSKTGQIATKFRISGEF